MRLLTKAASIFDRIIYAFGVVAALLLTLMMLIICLEFVSNYILHPIVWAIEITEYILLFITFLGTAWVLKIEGHVSVDILIGRLSPKNQARLGVVSSFLGIIVSLLLTIFGSVITWEFLLTRRFQSTQLLLPSAPFYAVIPIGSFLLFIQFVRRTCGFMAKLKGDPT